MHDCDESWPAEHNPLGAACFDPLDPNLSKLADEVSLGNMDAPEFGVRSRDEIGTLAESFNRMRKSLVQAMRMLES